MMKAIIQGITEKDWMEKAYFESSSNRQKLVGSENPDWIRPARHDKILIQFRFIKNCWNPTPDPASVLVCYYYFCCLCHVTELYFTHHIRSRSVSLFRSCKYSRFIVAFCVWTVETSERENAKLTYKILFQSLQQFRQRSNSKSYPSCWSVVHQVRWDTRSSCYNRLRW